MKSITYLHDPFELILNQQSRDIDNITKQFIFHVINNCNPIKRIINITKLNYITENKKKYKQIKNMPKSIFSGVMILGWKFKIITYDDLYDVQILISTINPILRGHTKLNAIFDERFDYSNIINSVILRGLYQPIDITDLIFEHNDSSLFEILEENSVDNQIDNNITNLNETNDFFTNEHVSISLMEENGIFKTDLYKIHDPENPLIGDKVDIEITFFVIN